MLHKMGPSTFLPEGREPLLSLKNPCYLCPLLPVSSRSKITLQLSLQTRFLAKPLRISVASIPTQNSALSSGSPLGLRRGSSLRTHGPSSRQSVLVTLSSILQAGIGVISGGRGPQDPRPPPPSASPTVAVSPSWNSLFATRSSWVI